MPNVESLLQLYGLALVVLPVYGFVSLRKRIRFDSLPKAAALVRYVAMVLAPVVAYAVIFLLCTGLEQLTSWSMIPEESARTFPLAIAIGLLIAVLGILVFSVGLMLVRTTQAPDSAERN